MIFNRPSKVLCVPHKVFKMACMENVPPEHGDSEMEEGEIVDEFDDLSDVSSEEEFLLRQRLQVLENYNNVLERKKTKAKHSSARSGNNNKRHNHNLYETSGQDLSDFAQFTPQQNIIIIRDSLKSFKTVHDVGYLNATPQYQNSKDPRPHKLYDKHRRKVPELPILPKTREKKKIYRKKRTEVTIISESEESEDEYRNKRRKLADAVAVNKGKSDTSSLQARLNKMLNRPSNSESIKTINQQIAIEHTILMKESSSSPITSKYNISNSENEDVFSIASSEVQSIFIKEQKENECKITDPIELSTDDDVTINLNIDMNAQEENNFEIINVDLVQDAIDCNAKEITEEKLVENKIDEGKNVEAQEKKNNEGKNLEAQEIKNDEENNSDDDLELLRQHALKTKSSKAVKATQDAPTKMPEKPPTEIPKESSTEIQRHQSEDEDSDTAELRLICLKSALLKKAIEMKQKQKLKKRLSQSIALDDFVLNDELYENIESGNNTDIEAMDMDIGSDGDEKTKEKAHNMGHTENEIAKNVTNKPKETEDVSKNVNKEEELDEDEDLLRARLLTSLSKNLPNLVDPTILNAFEESAVKKKTEETQLTVTKTIPKTTNTIPNPTKPISKPAKKLIINVGETDSEGEHEATKNLTKMHMKLSDQKDFQQKLDMFLKSARMEVEKEKLPDVAQRPSTPQKFVAKAVDHLPKSEQMEYKNLVKRMAELEKIKQTRQVSVTFTNKGLTKDTSRHTNLPNDSNNGINNLDEQITLSRKNIAEESARMLKLREEATKLLQKYKIVQTELRNISTAITLNKRGQRSAQGKLAKIRMQHQRLLNSSTSRHSNLNNHSLNMPSNKPTNNKTQKDNHPKDLYKECETQESLTISVVNDLNQDRIIEASLSIEVDVTSNKKIVKAGSAMESTEFESGNKNPAGEEDEKSKGDYESPLQALGGGTWSEDPNAILCPFEVGGRCKDADCKYLHPKTPTH